MLFSISFQMNKVFFFKLTISKIYFLGNIIVSKLKKNCLDRRVKDIFGQTTFIIVTLEIQQTIKNKANLPLEKVNKITSASPIS